MNITDLSYKYDIKIDFDGDFDGGSYTLNFEYMNCTHYMVKTKMELVLAQHEIDEFYEGAVQLVKLLKPHVTEDY